MSLAKPVVYDGAMQRQLQQGDLLAGGEVMPATSTSTAVTLTAALLTLGNYLASPAGAATFTLDTAANLITGLINQMGLGGIQNGTTFRFRIIITTAQTGTVTVTANTGVTVNRGAIASNQTKEFMVTIANGTPAQTFTGMTTNASAVVSGLTAAQCALLTPGMIVTNAVNGLQGTTILGVNSAAGAVTLSGNANATSTLPGVAISFSPVVTLDGLAA
jgi:hypothetical protein